MSKTTAPPRLAVFAGFLAVGFFAQIAQILLLRELLVVLDGDELALGIMLAAWLLFVGIGAAMTVRLSAVGPLVGRYALTMALAICSLSSSLVLVRLARPIFDAPLGAPLGLVDSVLLSCAAAVIPAGCIGMLFPLMVRVTRARPATAYGGESIGALLGGLLFVFVLVSRVSPLTIAAGTGMLAVGAAVYLLGTIRPAHKAAGGALVVLAVLCAVGVVLGGRWDQALERLRWGAALPGYDLLATRESPYGRYSLLRSSGQLSLFLDGRLQYDVPDPYATGGLVHTALLQHPDPRAVLIIGGGPGGNVRHAMQHHPQRIDCVELDPAPFGLLEAHAPAALLAEFAAEEVHVHHADPTALLEGSEEHYDAIIVDVGDPTTLGLNRLYDTRFFATVAEHLTRGGVLAIGISSQSNSLGPLMRQRNAVVYHTLRRVLPGAIATPGDHCLIIARKAAVSEATDSGGWPLTLDADVLAHRLLERDAEAPAYLAMLYTDPFPFDRVRVVNEELAAWPAPPVERSPLDLLDASQSAIVPPAATAPAGARVNSDLVPRAYWFSRLINTAKYEPEMLPIVQALPAVVRWGLGITAFAAVAAVLVTRRRARRGTNASDRSVRLRLTLASGVYSFAVMAMQMVIVLWYQSRLGQMYVGLAFLTAAFMAGVGAGSLLSSRFRKPRAVLLLTQLMMIAVVALLLLLGRLITPAGVVGAATFAAGGLGVMLGVHFACCSALWSSKPAHASGAARWLYGSDLIGGAAAALVVAAVVVPGDGLVAAMLWAALFAAVAAIITLRLPLARGPAR